MNAKTSLGFQFASNIQQRRLSIFLWFTFHFKFYTCIFKPRLNCSDLGVQFCMLFDSLFFLGLSSLGLYWKFAIAFRSIWVYLLCFFNQISQAKIIRNDCGFA